MNSETCRTCGHGRIVRVKSTNEHGETVTMKPCFCPECGYPIAPYCDLPACGKGRCCFGCDEKNCTNRCLNNLKKCGMWGFDR